MDNNSMLVEACQQGDLDRATALVAAGAEVNTEDGAPLRVAAQNGHAAVTQFLLSKDADVIITDSREVGHPLVGWGGSRRPRLSCAHGRSRACLGDALM
jgi:ankyrin repeat protein